MSETQNTSTIPAATVCKLLELLAQQLLGRANEREGRVKIAALLLGPDDDGIGFEEGIVRGLRLAENQVLHLHDTVRASLEAEAVQA